MPTIIKDIRIEVWNCNFNLLIGKTVYKCFKDVDMTEGNDKSYFDCNGMFTIIKEKAFIIAFKRDCISYEYIAHEAFHAVVGMLQYKGLSLAYQSEEAYAYMVGHLVRTIIGICREEGVTIND